METFKLSVEGKTEEWYPIDMAGWARQAVTGKKFGVTLTGKRDYGDPGNDYVAGMMMEIGVDCQSQLKWVLPNGATLQFDCVVNVTTPAGGDGTAMDTLEVEILSDGVPTYTPAV
jgi:hypothetical protein